MKVSCGNKVSYRGKNHKVAYVFNPSKEHPGYAVLDNNKTVFLSELNDPVKETRLEALARRIKQLKQKADKLS